MRFAVSIHTPNVARPVGRPPQALAAAEKSQNGNRLLHVPREVRVAMAEAGIPALVSALLATGAHGPEGRSRPQDFFQAGERIRQEHGLAEVPKGPLDGLTAAAAAERVPLGAALKLWEVMRKAYKMRDPQPSEVGQQVKGAIGKAMLLELRERVAANRFGPDRIQRGAVAYSADCSSVELERKDVDRKTVDRAVASFNALPVERQYELRQRVAGELVDAEMERAVGMTHHPSSVEDFASASALDRVQLYLNAVHNTGNRDPDAIHAAPVLAGIPTGRERVVRHQVYLPVSSLVAGIYNTSEPSQE